MEGKIHFVFKIFTKFAFKREPVSFNEKKILTLIQKGGKKINFTKIGHTLYRKNLIFSVKMDFIFGFSTIKLVRKW